MTIDYSRLTDKLSNPDYRIRNLFKILDKHGNEVDFRLNSMQEKVIAVKHPKRLILKARQHGISSLLLLESLSMALFQKLYMSAHVCHREDDAKKFLAKKIMFAYQRLPQIIKDTVQIESLNATRVRFTNGSIIECATMIRGDTYNSLHVSEMGKLVSQFPAKSVEVVSGAFPTAEKGKITVESTAEGRYGWFYNTCTQAEELHQLGEVLTPKDWHLTFLGWHENTDYELEAPHQFEFQRKDNEYFSELETKIDKKLSRSQRFWYVKERDTTLQELMPQEHPATSEEAFASVKDGTYFASRLAIARKEGRVSRVRYEGILPVYTSFDIGIGDATAIWWFSVFGREIYFYDYYEMEGEALDHYMEILESRRLEYKYKYATVFLPHDAGHREKRSGKTYAEGVEEAGYQVEVLQQPHNESVQIQSARATIPRCYFDKERCKEGLLKVERFHKQYSVQRGCFMTKSAHDENSHGAKSFMYACTGIETLKTASAAQMSAADWEELRRTA